MKSLEYSIEFTPTRFCFYKQPIFGVNVRVAQQIYVFKVKSCLEVAQQFPNFNFEKFILNTGSLQLVYIFSIVSIYLLNKIVKMIISDYNVYANHFHRPGIKATIFKINNFLFLPVSALKTIVTQLSCAKNSSGEIQLQ